MYNVLCDMNNKLLAVVLFLLALADCIWFIIEEAFKPIIVTQINVPSVSLRSNSAIV